jgi:hypothetical protein
MAQATKVARVGQAHGPDWEGEAPAEPHAHQAGHLFVAPQERRPPRNYHSSPNELGERQNETYQ